MSKKSLSRGVFITFEGIGGSGKSTQCKMLHDYIIELGFDVVRTSEPVPSSRDNQWYISDEIAMFIKKNEFADPFSDFFMMLAIRNEHFKMLIEPSLMKNKIVLCDRFIDSMYAYQGFGFGIDFELINNLNKIACGNSKFFNPNLTFVLDRNLSGSKGTDWKNIAEKRFSHKDKFRKIIEKDPMFLDRVREGFIKLAARDVSRYCLLDTSESEIHNRKEIRLKFDNLIKKLIVS